MSLCDCPQPCPLASHRWDCAATPIWAQIISDLDFNPRTWTAPAHRRLRLVPPLVEDWHGKVPHE